MEPEYIVKHGVFIRRTYQETILGPQTEILKSLSEQGYTILPDLFSLQVPTRRDYEFPKDTPEMIDIPVHAGRNGERLHLMHRLPYYPIYGHFTESPVEEDPVWSFRGRGDPTHRFGVEYPGLWMIYAFRLDNHRVVSFQNAFLITNIRGRHYAPQLPNIFDNGKICLGEIRVHYNGDVRQCIMKLFDDFLNSRSNDHLMRDNGYLILKFKETVDENGPKRSWCPPEEFLANPVPYHNNRGTAIAADMLTLITQLEDTDDSPKVMKEPTDGTAD